MQEEIIIPKGAKRTLRDIFQLFVRDELIRPVMNKPFLRNGKVYATNTLSLIFIDEKDCDFDYFNEYQEDSPVVENVIPAPNTSVFLNMPFTEFERFRTEDELKGFGKDVSCTSCDGEGVVAWEFEDWEKEFDCPKCDGNGLQEKKQYRKTGNKTFSRSATVRLLNASFSISNFYNLAIVQNMNNEPVELIFQGEHNKGFLFKIGIFTILMMPVIEHEELDETDILRIYPEVEDTNFDLRLGQVIIS